MRLLAAATGGENAVCSAFSDMPSFSACPYFLSSFLVWAAHISLCLCTRRNAAVDLSAG